VLNNYATSARQLDAHLIRRREPMKQGLQLLFAGPLPLNVTSQPPHDYKDPRPRGYLSAAMIQRRGQKAPFSRFQRARSIIGWKLQNNLRHARDCGNCHT
jgi:hypothetical protein